MNIKIDTLAPVGHILINSKGRVPSNYMKMDGRKLLIKDYPELFKAIGYSYTLQGNSNEYFNLPDAPHHYVCFSSVTDNPDMYTLITDIQTKLNQLKALLNPHDHSHELTPGINHTMGSEFYKGTK